MPDSLRDVALDVIAELLGMYDLNEEDELGAGDYTVKVVEEPTGRVKPNLVFHINVKDGTASGVLIGKGGGNLIHMQSVFYAAVAHRAGCDPRKEQGLWLEINGRRPDMGAVRNGNGDRKDGAPPEPMVVTVSAPAGVEVRIKSE